MSVLVPFNTFQAKRMEREIERLMAALPPAAPLIPQHHIDNAAAIPRHMMGNSIEFGPDGVTTINGGVREYHPYRSTELIAFAKEGAPPEIA